MGKKTQKAKNDPASGAGSILKANGHKDMVGLPWDPELSRQGLRMLAALGLVMMFIVIYWDMQESMLKKSDLVATTEEIVLEADGIQHTIPIGTEGVVTEITGNKDAPATVEIMGVQFAAPRHTVKRIEISKFDSETGL